MADLSKGTLPVGIIVTLFLGGASIVYAGASRASTIEATVAAGVTAQKATDAAVAKTDAGQQEADREVQRHRERLQSLEDSRNADAKWRTKVDETLEEILDRLPRRERAGHR